MNRLNVLPMTRLRAWRAPLGRSAVKSQGVTGTPEGRARFSRLAARFSSEAGVPVSRGILSPAPLSPAAPPLAPPASPMMAITEISKSATNPPTYVFSPTRLVPKVALIEEFRLPFRDLRKLDAGFGEQHPTVMVRPESGAILVSLEDIRCIITADRAILCDPDPASNGGLIPSPPHEAVDPSALPDMRAHPPPFHPPRTNSASRRALLRTLKSALQTSGKSSTLYTNNTTDELPSTVPAPPDAPTPPFEFLILETILQSVVSLLHARLSALQPQLVHTLRQIQLQHITHTTLESLLRLDRELTALHDSLDALQTAILEVLGNDADMVSSEYMLPSKP